MKTLSLENNLLGSSPLPRRLLEDLTALQWLSLRNNALRALPQGFLDGPRALSVLNLEDNLLGTEPLPEGFLRGQTTLEFLSLSNNQLGPNPLPRDLLQGMTALTRLELNDNALTPLSLTPEHFQGPADRKPLQVAIGGNQKLNPMSRDGFPKFVKLLFMR